MDLTDKLKDRSILIGKNPADSRLCIAMDVDGVTRVTTIDALGAVPPSVSRCRPDEHTAHCRLDIAGDGKMTLVNLNPKNSTCVDGTEIHNKLITSRSDVSLGYQGYKLDVLAVLEAASQLLLPQAPAGQARTGQQQLPQRQPMSIAHLDGVWQQYHDSNLEIKRRQKHYGLIKSLSPIFTLGAGTLSAISKAQDWPEAITYVSTAMTAIGVVIMIYGFYKSATDHSIEDSERALDEFQSNYVCPNAECHRFLGNQPYKLLRQMRKCPYCGTPYTTD